MLKTFSIILPVYKQSIQIESLVKNYSSGLNKLKTPYELLLVINGNDKSSYEVAKGLLKKYPNLKLLFLKEAGWGKAINAGVKKSTGRYICYTNSARTKIPDLVSILRLAKRNPNTVIKATRILRLGIKRQIGSGLFNLECRLLLKTPIWDINGTPKVVPKKIINKFALKSHDDLIDAELIAKCVVQNVPILEVPILFPARFGGKSTTNYLSAIKMYVGVFRIEKMLRKKIKTLQLSRFK